MPTFVKYQHQNLVNDIRNLIDAAKERAITAAKNELVTAYWQIGQRIENTKLTNNAKYYSAALQDLAKEVGIDPSILRRTVIFFRTYPNGLGIKETILTWSHYKSLITIKNNDLRTELEEKARTENWSRNKLIEAIKFQANENEKPTNSKIKRPTTANYLYKANIKRVIDGDTLLLNIDLGFQVAKEQRLRLTQIDAAEIKTVAGQKAFKYLKSLASRLETIIVRTNKIDIYGRYLGDIFYPKIANGKKISQIEIFEKGIYLNEELVQKGFAKII